MKQQLEAKEKQANTSAGTMPRSSAFDAQGINKAVYTNNFDSDLMHSYTQQLIALSKQANDYHARKMKIKENVQKYKTYLENGSISQEQYDSYISSYLKGNDEYQVAAMHDAAISSLVGKMRSYTDAIFQYMDNHTYTIPLVERPKPTEEPHGTAASAKTVQKSNEPDPESLGKEDEKSVLRKVYTDAVGKKDIYKTKLQSDREKWETQADIFAKSKKKQNFGDSFAKGFKSLFMTDIKKKKHTDVIEKRGEKASFTDKMKVVFNMITSSKKSPFDKDRKKHGINSILKKYGKKDEVIAQKTALSDRFKNLRRIKIETQDEEEGKLGLLGEQSRSEIGLDAIARRDKKDKSITYSASSYSALANILMKDVSLEFINSFPDFFKNLYRTLRLANIKILSSSYTNMMLLSSSIGGVSTIAIVGFWSLVAALPLGMVIANAFLGGIFGGVAVFIGYYAYPNYEMKRRDRDIKTNIPFAIDHMAAIVSAGVSPNAMFGLISESKDYGEFSVEIEKVVEYIELFGYDMLSAIKSVSSLTPSETMKDFLEGFISAIESGGDLKRYLREKAEATMLEYKLERQRYTESVSTFSDIYTGIMVASPLFFVAVLSLVSILGGTVGNMDINTLMILGTYVAIPLMNVVFIGFMELTQPNL